MKHLSALDALFLQMETAETPMHVGSIQILDKPKGRRAASAYPALRAHVAGRMHLAPVFTRRLGFMPLDLVNPVWLDAENIDLDHHIRHLVLPKPGSDAQLEAAVAKLHEGMLDRERPLWQFTVIEGLAHGRVGLYAKIHHAALDGQGGVAVAVALLDTQRKPRATPGHVRPARMPPTTARMLGAALRHTVAQLGGIVKALPTAAKAVVGVGAAALTSAQIRKMGFSLGPRTALNAAIGPRRSFVMTQVPLAEAKEIAHHFEVKLNDVVLAICAGALRRQFARDKAALAKSMIGAVPASLRTPGDTTRANDVTMMLVDLATRIADPVKRMAAIRASSTRAKMLTGGAKGVIPTDMPSLGVPWLMSRVMPLYRKAAASERIPVVANIVISNVPGPQMPLYLAGLEMIAYYPVSIVTHGLALNVTILSYNGHLDFGLIACSKAVPGLRGFAKHVRDAHRELLREARK